MSWADKHRTLNVRTNADTPAMAKQAVAFGAEGIGLCRTEHMFFDGERIDIMRQMILAADEVQRRSALKSFLAIPEKTSSACSKRWKVAPVTIRLLDPPLHEFLPTTTSFVAVSRETRRAFQISSSIALKPHERRTPARCRGCRLGIIYPEITEMQGARPFEAAAQWEQR